MRALEKNMLIVSTVEPKPSPPVAESTLSVPPYLNNSIKIVNGDHDPQGSDLNGDHQASVRDKVEDEMIKDAEMKEVEEEKPEMSTSSEGPDQQQQTEVTMHTLPNSI